jgi:hypothetical protein
VKGKTHFITVSNDILYLDFGFKHEVEVFKNEFRTRLSSTLSINKLCNYIKPISTVLFNIVALESFFFHKILIETQKNHINLQLFYFLLLLQNKNQNKPIKYYIKGRFLNPLKGGLAIGVCGYVSFLPLSHALFKKFGLCALFYILSIDIEKKIFVVSQSKIDIRLRKQLKKLKARFLNI